MINSALKRQVKSNDELMHRLIEERNQKKLANSNANPSSSSSSSSSSSCMINFTQTNPQINGTSMGGATMPNP
jgi:hypothetical protein